MKHEDIITALLKIATTGATGNLTKDEIAQLKAYTLIDVIKADGKGKKETYTLTKKGRVMLKANTKAPKSEDAE
jgi:predicted transcriptional regulator